MAEPVFHRIEVQVDTDGNRKRLLIDGQEVWHVKDVLIGFSTDPLAEVTVTFYSDAVTVMEMPAGGDD